MCGIAGLLLETPDAARRPEAAETVEAMASRLAHRGPDDSGLLVTGPAVLGHRRLSILDLSPRGRQPMTAAEGRLALVYNGEIYNYVELRAELEGHGFTFRSGTDTEVLLAAYERWGEDCLGRLNGMWAFALWDEARGKLFCARDRLGIKPFYWTCIEGRAFAFASEPKAFRELPTWPPEPDLGTVREFLVTGVADGGERTFFEGIRSLPAAHRFTVAPGEEPRPVRYWTAHDEESRSPTDHDEIVARARDLLRDAVRVRLRADVPVGTCLSGGIDSSSVVGLVAELREKAGIPGQHTFSACFEDEGIDERPYMDLVLARSETAAHRVFPRSANLLEDLEELVRVQDEPFGSTSIYAQYRVFRLVRESEVIVTLDGQGADELLAGYDAHHGTFVVDLLLRGRLLAAWRQGRALARLRNGTLRRLVRHGIGRRRRMRGRARRPGDWLTEEVAGARGEDPHRVREPGRGGLLQDHLWADLTRQILPSLLRYADRNAMAHSVEARFPFLDYRFVELARALPPSELIRDGWTKAVLRDAAEPWVPPAVRWRKDKIGFQPPEARWFREALGDRFQAVLDDPADTIARFVRPERIREQWKRFREGAGGFRPMFWRLLNLDLWLRSL